MILHHSNGVKYQVVANVLGMNRKAPGTGTLPVEKRTTYTISRTIERESDDVHGGKNDESFRARELAKHIHDPTSSISLASSVPKPNTPDSRHRTKKSDEIIIFAPLHDDNSTLAHCCVERVHATPFAIGQLAIEFRFSFYNEKHSTYYLNIWAFYLLH